MTPAEPDDQMTQILVVLAEIKTRVEGFANGHDDHERRIRELKAWQDSARFVTPGQLWGGLLGVAAVVSAVTSFVNAMFG